MDDRIAFGAAICAAVYLFVTYKKDPPLRWLVPVLAAQVERSRTEWTYSEDFDGRFSTGLTAEQEAGAEHGYYKCADSRFFYYKQGHVEVFDGLFFGYGLRARFENSEFKTGEVEGIPLSGDFGQLNRDLRAGLGRFLKIVRTVHNARQR